MLILGIETSCDETAAAVVEDGRRVLSNIVSSQVDLHARYGGIVPEVASRQHLLAMEDVISEALGKAMVPLRCLDAVAVTHGPGLAGALLVGVNYAKGLTQALSLPLLGINHLEGHLYAAWLLGFHPEQQPGFPLLGLIASGGHTDLVLMENHGIFRLLGRTRDDAAGEAFDKAARIVGLGFPGGPAIQRMAEGARGSERLPRAWLPGTFDFSFSGLKTAFLHLAQKHRLYPVPVDSEIDTDTVREVSAAFQEAVVDVLVTKAEKAAREYQARGVVLGGGVAANALLRERMTQSLPVPVLIPPPDLCTDNGAMIAACAFFHLRDANLTEGTLIDVDPSLSLGTLL